MNRRTAIYNTAALIGGTLVGSQILVSSCTQQVETLTILDTDFLDLVADTILPATTESGGAKAAGLGPFMQKIVTECYDQKDAVRFEEGMNDIEKRAQIKYGKGFAVLTNDERFEIINAIDQEARKQEDHYFSLMKDLTLWGYFSSEVGCTQALRYNPIPGRFEGCIPYNNEPAWAG